MNIMTETYSWVVLEDGVPCRWEDDTVEGRLAAQQYADSCNRNYQGSWTVKRLADRDTLGFVRRVTSDLELARAVVALKGK